MALTTTYLGSRNLAANRRHEGELTRPSAALVYLARGHLRDMLLTHQVWGPIIHALPPNWRFPLYFRDCKTHKVLMVYDHLINMYALVRVDYVDMPPARKHTPRKHRAQEQRPILDMVGSHKDPNLLLLRYPKECADLFQGSCCKVCELPVCRCPVFLGTVPYDEGKSQSVELDFVDFVDDFEWEDD